MMTLIDKMGKSHRISWQVIRGKKVYIYGDLLSKSFTRLCRLIIKDIGGKR